MKRKVIPMLLTAAMIASTLTVPAFAAPFSDTNGHWGENAIERWSDHGVVNGSDGKFRPDDSLTRAELATIVANLLKLDAMPESNPFGDLDQNWYTDAILKCYEAGIMSGDGATVRPNDPVTREEAMVILSNALRIAPQAGDVTGFDDAHKVSNWAEGAVNALLDAGIVSGVGDGALAPQGLINRASVVTILNNAIGSYVSEDGTSIEANGGMVLVVGDDVTVTGEADSVLVLGSDTDVELKDLEVKGDVTVAGEGAKVELSGETKAESVIVAEEAKSTEVKVGEDAVVETVETEAEGTVVAVEGTVSEVKVGETAKETDLKVEETGKVETVETKADEVEISGKGEVGKVEASGDNTTVTTPDTKVEATEGTTGVTAGGETVTGGESATTTPAEKPSSGGGSSHSHNYRAEWVDETTGDEYKTCSCGAKQATGRKVAISEASLKAALKTNGKVILGSDIELETMVEVPEGVKVTLDLNGYKIAMAEEIITTTYAINNLGTLTLKDSVGTGSVSARGIYNGYGNGGENLTTAKITIESGTYYAMGTNGGAAILNYGEAEINGGTYDGYVCFNTRAGSEMTINKATVHGGTTGSYRIQNNGGNLTINDATVDGGFGAVGCYSGVTVINDGDFQPTGSKGKTCHVVYLADAANVTINGGNFKMNYPEDAVPDSGSAVASYYNGTLEINGGTFVSHFDSVSPVELSSGSVIKGGTYLIHSGAASQHSYVKNFLADDYTLGEDGKVNAPVYVVQIGEKGYKTLQKAIDAAREKDEIVFQANIEQKDGVTITDKKLTIDLNDKTFTVTEGASTNNRNFKINGSSEVTIKNGTMVAAGDYSSGAYGTVRTEGSAKVTLTDLELYNYRGNGLNIKALGGTKVDISATEIYSQYGGGIEAAGGIITLEDVTVEQVGMYTAPYNSMAISVNGGGQVTVNSGTYSTVPLTAEDANNQGSSHGSWAVGVLNSGGKLIINGGTFSNGNYGDDALATAARGLILADAAANVEVNGGTFNALSKIVDIQNNLGDASKNPVVTLKGGTFSSDPMTGNISNCIEMADGCKAMKVADDEYVILQGNGTEKDPYKIATAAELKALNNGMKEKSIGKGVYVKITDDIDFDGYEWTPVDSHVDTNFWITEIDGAGHTISNMTINGQAMFTRFAGSGDVTIENITFDKATVNSTALNSAILTVQSYQNVLLDNVDVKNSTITGSYKVAPLMGTVYDESPSTVTATLKDCDVSNCVVTSNLDFMVTGMIAFVYEENNDKVVFENCTVTDVKLQAKSSGYNAYAAIYTYDGAPEGCINEAEGVTVTNVTYEVLS